MGRRASNRDRRPASAKPKEAERDLSEAEERWLDLIADIIVEELRNKDLQ